MRSETYEKTAAGSNFLPRTPHNCRLRIIAHVSVTGRDPDSRACCDRDHRCSRRSNTRDNAVISTPASTITRQAVPTTISIRPLAGVARTVDPTAAGSGVTIAGTKEG
jgi:hypothetical protein